jgi:hypothetical protein
MLSGQRVEIAHPALRADTLASTSDRAIGIPLGQVQVLEVRRPSARTGALIGGSAIGAMAATVGVVCIMFCGSTD